MPSPYRVLAYTVLPLLRWRISKVEGLEHLPANGGYILVANHQSWIDSGILAGAVFQRINKSLRFVAQSSKYRIFGGIPINEYDKGKVLDIAYGYLQSGHPIVIFPEGNSNKNPGLRSGKTGAGRLALRSGAPVVPVGIQGTKGTKLWQSWLWYFGFWRPCRVTIGSPLSFPKTDLASVDYDHLMTVTNEIMTRISEVSGKPFDPNQPPPWMVPSKAFLEKLIWSFYYPLARHRIRVRGAGYLPEHGPYIIAGNHISYFDPGAMSIAVLQQRNIRPFFITKASIARIWRRVLGQNAWKALGMLPIDEQEKTKVVRTAEVHLRHGGVIGIFPEGTRNRPKVNPQWKTHLLKGKTGAARLVLATNVPVIPAGIDAPPGLGAWQILVSALQFWRPVVVTFGPPVVFGPRPIGEPTKDDLEAMTRAMMVRIAELSGMEYEY